MVFSEIIYKPFCFHRFLWYAIPTPGLLAQVLVGKYANQLPLYRQEAIFGHPKLATYLRRAWPRTPTVACE